MAKNPNKIKPKRTVGDYVIVTIMVIVIVLVFVTTIYPFLNALALSLNKADDTMRGGITFYPRVFTLKNYETIFSNPKIWNAYLITILRTVIGTITGLLFTGTLAFALSRTHLEGKRFYTMFCLIPMYFGGGLMPTYFLYKGLGLTNNFLVYIIPSLVNLWNMILMRSYFASVPEALEEAARIDGANYLTVFFKIFMPISTPIIATICLYIGVFHWNDWFIANIYISSESLKPMQSVLLSIINEAAYAERIAAQAGGMAGMDMGNIGRGKEVNVRSTTMATMIVTIIPVLVIYPFIQRYFMKGIMIGSIKG